MQRVIRSVRRKDSSELFNIENSDRSLGKKTNKSYRTLIIW